MRSVLFQIGPIPIRAYGLMLWIALVLGLIYTLRASRRTSIKPDNVVDIALYSLVFGILGAHLMSILLDLPYYVGHPYEAVALWKGILSPSGGLRGLSFHGGLIGAVVAVLVYSRRKGLSFPAVADLFSPALALGYAIARIGCFLNGCCYGVETHVPWAVRFHLDPGSPALTPPSHPTQIYSSLASLAIFGSLVWMQKRRRFTGQTFLSYLAMYSVYRFLVEFLRRGVTGEVLAAGLTEAQIASLAVLALALVLLYVGSRSASAKATTDKTADRSEIPNPKSAIRNPKSEIPKGG